MGFLWLGVSPLVQGWIAQTFGLRWRAMIAGVALLQPPDRQLYRRLRGRLALLT